jgi:hypothetical protein
MSSSLTFDSAAGIFSSTAAADLSAQAPGQDWFGYSNLDAGSVTSLDAFAPNASVEEVAQQILSRLLQPSS